LKGRAGIASHSHEAMKKGRKGEIPLMLSFSPAIFNKLSIDEPAGTLISLELAASAFDTFIFIIPYHTIPYHSPPHSNIWQTNEILIVEREGKLLFPAIDSNIIAHHQWHVNNEHHDIS
jgi:hypothetical protein